MANSNLISVDLVVMRPWVVNPCFSPLQPELCLSQCLVHRSTQGISLYHNKCKSFYIKARGACSSWGWGTQYFVDKHLRTYIFQHAC